MSVDLLAELLPLSYNEVRRILHFFREANLLEKTITGWQVSLLGYPAVRQFLAHEGYLVDGFCCDVQGAPCGVEQHPFDVPGPIRPRILEHPTARIHKFAEEHGFLDLARCNDKPNVGDIVRVVPNHVCVAVNMVDQLVAVRGGVVEEVIRVEARGKLV